MCRIVGYGHVGYAGTVVALECCAEDELGEDQFDHPDLHLWKIRQEQFVPGSSEPKVSRQAVVVE